MKDLSKSKDGGKVAASSAHKVGRDSSTGQFVQAAARMRKTQTGSADVARSKLKELGILSSNGGLSKNYK